jgi:threonine/homoserine/homoserine lactone efflux protein
MGRIYVPVMLVSLLTALGTIVDGTQFLFFHIRAFVGLWLLWSGMRNLRRWLKGGDPVHLRNHKIDMAFSWLGLFMAGVSQFLVNPRFGLAEYTTGWTYWSLFGAINIVFYAAGSWWIYRRLVGPPEEQATR